MIDNIHKLRHHEFVISVNVIRIWLSLYIALNHQDLSLNPPTIP